jgi:hypothetical protein
MHSSAFRPITIVILVLLLAGLGSYASGGARLEALADDGLLLVDVQTDHMWPGSLADHGPAITWQGWLARNDQDTRPHGGGIAGDYRHEVGQKWVGRVYWANHPDLGSDNLNSVVQVGWKHGRAGVGLAWSRTSRDQNDSRAEDEHSVLALGMRISLDTETVVDVTLEQRTSTSNWNSGNGSLGLRARFHRTVLPWLTAVGTVERTSHKTTRDLHTQTQAGFLIWPDPDLQILVSWMDGRALINPEDIFHGSGYGLHVAAEARVSSWLSWRSGVVVTWPGQEQRNTQVSRLGLGGTLHAGHYDAVLGWSLTRDSEAPGLVSGNLDDSRLHMELTRWF